MTRWLRRWVAKFRYAGQGLATAWSSPSSFIVHVPAAIIVLVIAGWLRVEAWRWCVLLIAIGGVFSLELINSAIERLAHRLHPDHDAEIGRVLDLAAAAVLVMSLTAVLLGLIALGPPLYTRLLSLR